jgi:hypothetical protein
MTPSAVASSVVGTSRPSALAVLRLIIVSFFVGKDKASADRISDHHEHDRHGVSDGVERRHTRIARGEDDIRRERH